jgi:hypothetical protein
MYRYRMLLPLGYANDPKNKDKSGQLDLFAVAKNILSKVPCPSDDGSLQWQLGKSKVFMKEAQARALNQPLVAVVVCFLLYGLTRCTTPQSAAVENTRNKAIWAKVVTIQSWWRMVWTRNYFAEMRQAAKLIQKGTVPLVSLTVFGLLTNWLSSFRRAPQSCEGSSNGVDMLC